MAYYSSNDELPPVCPFILGLLVTDERAERAMFLSGWLGDCLTISEITKNGLFISIRVVSKMIESKVVVILIAT